MRKSNAYHSQMGDLMRCSNRRNNSYNELNNIMLVCNSVCNCMKAVKLTDSYIRDGKNIRSSKAPGPATTWEIRTVMGWGEGYPIDKQRFKGTVKRNGDIEVFDKIKATVSGYMTAAELAQKEEEYYSNKGIKFVNGSSNQSRFGSNNGFSNVNSLNTQMASNAIENTRENKSKLMSILTSIGAAMALITAIVASMEQIGSATRTMSAISGISSRVGNAISSLGKGKKEAQSLEQTAGSTSDMKQMKEQMTDIQNTLTALLREGKDAAKAQAKTQRLKQQTRALTNSMSKVRELYKNGSLPDRLKK